MSMDSVGFFRHSPLSICYAATLAPPIVTTTSGISFFKFLMVFTAGGLFFSTAIAAITACYAMGMDNVRRIWELVMMILKQVWITFTLGLSATKLALLGGDEEQTQTDRSTEESEAGKFAKKAWQWRLAWNVLKEKLGETRKTAAQGVLALRQEAKLYTAVLGPPGLVPLQYVIDRLLPFSLSTIMEESIRNSLADFPKQKTIKKMTLSSFKPGNRPPVLQAARVYDVEDAIAFDCTVKWDSELDASVQIYSVGGLARVPVSLKNMKFEGTLRVVLTPLTVTAPGYGAVLVSLARPPRINLDVSILGGELTKLPFLRHEITSAMQKAIADQLLWPRRTVIPSTMDGSKRTILSARQLASLQTTDPLLEAERALAEEPMLKSLHDTTAPLKEESRMFHLNEVNHTDATSLVATKETETKVQSHHNAERGILLRSLQGMFTPRDTKAKEESITSTPDTLRNPIV